MRRLFAVKGLPHSGKGKTVRLVLSKLLDEFPDAEKILCQPSAKSKDVCAVLSIDGTRIGFESNNHPKDLTEKSLKLFSKKRCDVIICATLTTGHTVEAFRNRFADRKITWIDLLKPASMSAREKACRAKADEIFDEVRAILIGKRKLTAE